MPTQSRVIHGPEAVPRAEGVGPGQILMSLDGYNWWPVCPVVSGADGWLSNADGELLIEGLFDVEES